MDGCLAKQDFFPAHADVMYVSKPFGISLLMGIAYNVQ